jgi:hypothetical protein
MGDYQLTLRGLLDTYGRAMSLGRAVTWGTRGLALGLGFDAMLLLAAWVRLVVPSGVLLLSVPVVLTLGIAVISAAQPRTREWLARRVDERLALAERSLTAVGGPTDGSATNPLYLWQLRDAVEHLERGEPLRSFPVVLPQREAFVALAFAALAAVLLVVPSPFPQRTAALDPKGQLVKDEAERLTRVAQSMAEDPALQSKELEQVRELLRQAARNLEERIDEPERAAASIEELERQLQAMANADQELATALATVASALASTPETRDLGLAFQSGDLKDVSRAARDLARQAEGMSENARARAGNALRMAAEQAGNDAMGVGDRLRQAANALDPQGAEGLSDREALARAQSALRELAEQSASAAARQRAQSAMEGARNALNRGQSAGLQGTQGSFGRETARQRGQGEQGSQGAQGGQQGAEGEGQEGEGEEQGSGFGTGSLNNQGEASRLDAMTRPEQVRSGQAAAPDEVGDAPLLQQAGANPSQVGDESVQPQFGGQTATDPSVDASIPLGLRELVKQYFSSQESAR